MAETTYNIGDTVRIIIDPPGGEVITGTVVVVNDPEEHPGKHIGVELPRFIDKAHSLDGLVEERVDTSRGITVGKGWWVTPYHIELVTE